MSESFEDALKKVLVTEKKQKEKPIPIPKRKRTKPSYVKEALNSNSMPDTMTPSGYSGGPRGMPPFSKYTTDSQAGSIDMRDIGKQDEEFAKSDKYKPKQYPFAGALELIVSSGQSLNSVSRTLEETLRKFSNTKSPETKELIKDALQAIKSSLGNISKAAKSIDSIK